ncbi:MAG: efflux RND transporter periplasmic adaptor subunit [Actinomycetota bacterium]
MNRRTTQIASVALLAVVLLTPAALRAQEEEAGHMHGPDGRHVAVAETSGTSTGKSVLSHHDLMITDTNKLSSNEAGAVVEGADVHSVIHKKGDPQAVVHREHNTFEPENGVYGSHMMYREPGEYVIVENVTLPGGKKYALEFPIWVPEPAGAKDLAASPSPVLLGAVALGVLALLAAAFLLGRRSGRRTASGLSLLAVMAGLAPMSPSRAEEEEAGHMHGPDGRHIAVAETFGAKAGEPLRAFLGPNREIEAFLTRDHYRFRLSIENEELAPPDPDVVQLAPAAVKAVGLELATASSRAVGGGLSTTGQVRPNPNGEVTVNSRVSGRIIRMSVTPGQAVSRGQVVAVIDSTEVGEAQAALSRAQAEVRQTEASRGSARAEVRRMQALMAEAEAGLQRVQAQRAEAQAEVEHARAEVGVARGKAESARKVLARQQQLAAGGAFSQAPVETARAGVAEAEGELRAAQTALANSEAQARRMEQGLKDGVVARREVEAAQTAAAQGRTRLTTAERQLQIARAALAREERIQRENLRDAREVEAAQAGLDAAQLGIRSAEAEAVRQQKALDAAEAQIGAQRRAVESAQAQVEGARSEAREADAAAAGAREAVRAALNRLQLFGVKAGSGNQVAITAPMSGHVHSRPVNVGQVVAAGELLATVVNTDSVWVESNVFEKDLPRIRLGQRVTIGADAVPGRTFEGSVSYISHDVDPTTRAVQLRTVVPNSNELLKPNMFVRVIIGVGQSGAGVTVPIDALQEQGGEQVVFVAETEGVYRRKVVQVGATLGDQVVIEAGVKPGERVVTRGSYQLLAKVRK